MVQNILYPFFLIRKSSQSGQINFRKSDICNLMTFEAWQFDSSRREFLLTPEAFVGISGLSTIPLEVAVEHNTS